MAQPVWVTSRLPVGEWDPQRCPSGSSSPFFANLATKPQDQGFWGSNIPLNPHSHRLSWDLNVLRLVSLLPFFRVNSTPNEGLGLTTPTEPTRHPSVNLEVQVLSPFPIGSLAPSLSHIPSPPPSKTNQQTNCTNRFLCISLSRGTLRGLEAGNLSPFSGAGKIQSFIVQSRIPGIS